MIGQCRSIKRYNVIILAGGKGTRMGPMADHIPKALTPFGNVRAIDHIIDRYKLIAHKFIIGTGYNGDLLKNYLLGRYPNEMFHFSEEDEVINNAVSARYCLDFADSHFPTIISFCDLIMIGNTEVSGDKLYFATTKTWGNVGTFRHYVAAGIVSEYPDAPRSVDQIPGLLGCFIFDDTRSLKQFAYLNDKVDDVTNDIVRPYFGFKYGMNYSAVFEEAQAVVEFGTEIDLVEARRVWENL